MNDQYYDRDAYRATADADTEAEYEEGQLAAADAIVRAAVRLGVLYWKDKHFICRWCGCMAGEYQRAEHRSDCLYLRAQQYVVDYPGEGR